MSRYEDAVARIDLENARDPNTETVDGKAIPAALLYGQRMSSRLAALEPGASEALKLACRAQHLRRFEVPRDSYPMDRAGYHRWRTDLAKLHAEHAKAILVDVGYEDATISRVSSLLRKKDLAKDPEAQTLEDVACLVFLEHHYASFIDGKDDDSIVRILSKTWAKMSDAGRRAAASVELEGRAKALLEKALA